MALVATNTSIKINMRAEASFSGQRHSPIQLRPCGGQLNLLIDQSGGRWPEDIFQQNSDIRYELSDSHLSILNDQNSWFVV